MNEIDFVIIWVDGNDPAWLAKKREYQVGKGMDSSAIRYRDWDNLRYWFRAVERYAPWVNRIHFVTWGHMPAWLNTEAPKLNIVRHEDYIPQEYLPTFSSHTIELNLHRIRGLSENFVYFNDDTFLNAPVKPQNFFINGRPVRQFVLSAVLPNDDPISSITFNNIRVINRNFDKKEFLKKNFRLLLFPLNGMVGIKNMTMLPFSLFTGFQTDHLPTPYTKSLFQEVWEKEGDILKETCSHKFRGREDVNQWLFLYWSMVCGDFIPCGKRGEYYNMTLDNSKLFNIIQEERVKMFCCNDSSNIGDFESRKQELLVIFEEKFPQKSAFEI